MNAKQTSAVLGIILASCSSIPERREYRNSPANDDTGVVRIVRNHDQTSRNMKVVEQGFETGATLMGLYAATIEASYKGLESVSTILRMFTGDRGGSAYGTQSDSEANPRR